MTTLVVAIVALAIGVVGGSIAVARALGRLSGRVDALEDGGEEKAAPRRYMDDSAIQLKPQIDVSAMDRFLRSARRERR